VQVGNRVVLKALLEVVDGHKEFTRLEVVKLDVFLELRREVEVVGTVFACPRLLAVWDFERVAHLEDVSFAAIRPLKSVNILNYIAVSSNEAVPLYVTGSCDQVVFFNCVLELLQNLLACLHAILELLGWSTSQEPCSFCLRSGADHFVVNMNFGECLFDKWHPPTSVNSWLCKSSGVRINREYIIDGDVFRTPFNECFDCKNALARVSLLRKQVLDEVGFLSQRCKNCKQVVVADRALF